MGTPTFCILDLETNGFLDKEDLRIHCFQFKFLNEDRVHVYDHNQEEAIELLKEIDPIYVIHNGIAFDVEVLKKVHGFIIPEEKILDTLVMSRCLFHDYPRHSLEEWGRRLGFPKSDYSYVFKEKELQKKKDIKNALVAELGIREYNKRVREGTIVPYECKSEWEMWSQDMSDYCSQDILVLEKLFKHLVQEMKNQKMSMETLRVLQEYFGIMARQQAKGVYIDLELAHKNRAELSHDVMRVQQFLEEKIGLDFTTNTHDIKRFLYEYCEHKDYLKLFERTETYLGHKKINPMYTPAAGKEHLTYSFKNEIMEESGDKFLKAVGSLRRKVKLLSFFTGSQTTDGFGDNGIINMTDENNRLHGRVVTYNAATFRSTHNSPNLANIPVHDKELSPILRSSFTVPKGYKMVGVDASQLELRMLAHYLYPYDGGKLVKEVLSDKPNDIHTQNQHRVGLKTRDEAKTFIYALIYGAGDEKLAKQVNPLNYSARIGKEYRERFLNTIVGFRDLQNDVINQLKLNGYIKLINGLRVYPAQYTSLNYLLQGSGMMVMVYANVIFWRRLYEIFGNSTEALKRINQVLSVHDECQFEVLDSKNNRYGPAWVGQLFVDCIKDAGVMLNLHCPMDGEYKIGNNWYETH